MIIDWNDVDGRTIAQVLEALYGAADEWERIHLRICGGDPMSGHTVKPPVTPSKQRRRDVVENDAYADFARRIIRAYSSRVATGGDIEAIVTSSSLSDQVDEAIGTAIGGLREFGYSWA